MDGIMLPAALATILGVIAPIVVSFIKQVSWPPLAVQAVVVVVSLGAAVLALAVSGTFQSASITVESLIGYGAYIATVAQLVYQTYFKGTVLNGRLERIGGVAPPSGGG